jgi:GT2 family glycosyltransferase
MLYNCLKSIINSSYYSFIQIIVVDNNSKDESVSMIEKEFPEVLLIKNTQNVGFSKANNQGFSKALGKYVFILNPDTIITQDNIRILVESLESDPKIGMVGPKVLYEDGSIQRTCARKLPTLSKAFFLDALQFNKIPFIGSLLDKRIRFPYNYEEEQDVQAGVGAAMLVKKNVLVDLGGFNPSFFHAGEDNYLCYSIWKMGYRIRYIPGTSIIHFTAESAKQANVRSTVNSILSNALFYRLSKGYVAYLVYKWIMMLVFVPTRLVSLVSKVGNPRAYSEQFRILKGIFRWKEIVE